MIWANIGCGCNGIKQLAKWASVVDEILIMHTVKMNSSKSLIDVYNPASA